MLYHFTKRILLLGLIFGLSACGGGGGGDAPFVPVSYNGATNPAAIDATNASSLAASSYSGSDLGSAVPLASSANMDGAVTAASAPLIPSIATLNQALPEMVANAPGAPSMAMMSFNNQKSTCGSGGTMTMSGSMATNQMSMSVSMDFSGCNENGTLLNGGITMDLTSNMVDPSGGPLVTAPAKVTVRMTFLNTNMILATGENLTSYGSVSMTRNMAGLNPVTDMTMSLVALDNVSGLASKIENYHVTVTEYTSYDEIDILSARFYHHDYGYVDVSTPTPLRDDPLFQDPTNGVLLIQGAGGSSATVDFSFAPPQGSWDDGLGGAGAFTL